MNVLLIDDHVLFREGLKFLLRSLDAALEVDEAGDCAKALEHGARRGYDFRPAGLDRGARRGSAHDRALLDGEVDERGEDSERDRDQPHDPVRAGVVEQVPA